MSRTTPLGTSSNVRICPPIGQIERTNRAPALKLLGVNLAGLEHRLRIVMVRRILRPHHEDDRLWRGSTRQSGLTGRACRSLTRQGQSAPCTQDHRRRQTQFLSPIHDDGPFWNISGGGKSGRRLIGGDSNGMSSVQSNSVWHYGLILLARTPHRKPDVADEYPVNIEGRARTLLMGWRGRLSRGRERVGPGIRPGHRVRLACRPGMA